MGKMSDSPTRRWQRRRVAGGRCMRCGAARQSFPDYCDPCQERKRAEGRAYYRRVQAARRAARIQAGLCEVCGIPRGENGRYCDHHRETRNAWRRGGDQTEKGGRGAGP